MRGIELKSLHLERSRFGANGQERTRTRKRSEPLLYRSAISSELQRGASRRGGVNPRGRNGTGGVAACGRSQRLRTRAGVDAQGIKRKRGVEGEPQERRRRKVAGSLGML